jgi:acid stress chaperone HdeA
MKASALLATTVFITLVGSTMAGPLATSTMPAKADKAAAKGIKPEKLRCEEFLALDDVTRPALVYWAEGVNSKGKPEDAVFDVETTNRLVPVLIEDCKQEPKASFWTKMKVELKKVF